MPDLIPGWWRDVPEALAGGALIGVATGALWLGLGRVGGVSGVLGGLLTPHEPGQRSWRLAMLAGLVVGGLIVRVAAPAAFAPSSTGWVGLGAAGLLVGVGTRMGHGCTSGHGVCGNARRSPRSLAATAVFMALGFVTVAAARAWGAA